MIQIHRTPALRQSVYEDMACPHLYRVKHVERLRDSTSPDAARGTEIHDIIATYIPHLVQNKFRKDLGFLDRLISSASESAREVLDRFRDKYEFDPEKVVGTEIPIALDEDFQPVEIGDATAYVSASDWESVAYLAKLDLVLMHSETEAEVTDWKTYYQIINADTFQSKFYPLLLSCWNPAL